MLRFQRWPGKWWNKPLVDLGDRILPAELAVLAAEVGPCEQGAWINSRGTKTGVVDLVPEPSAADPQAFETSRKPLPRFVSEALAAVYERSGLSKGCPDLVIWDLMSQRLRLVEVKCPHWDRPSIEQTKFMQVAFEMGIPTSIAEWGFVTPEPGSADRAALLAQVCALASDDPNAAADHLRAAYPFVPSRPKRQSFSKRQAMAVFARDGFVDRFSGERLVNPGALRILAYLLPQDFPYHPHGRRDKSHVAFWELWPSVDHVVPLALGGAHEMANFATTSMLRNLAKRNATLEQLGWSLHEPGRLADWDGLSSWFIEMVDATPEARQIAHIRDWYGATLATLEQRGPAIA